MTRVIGQVFDALAKFPFSEEPPEQAKKRLLHDVGIAAIELIALAAGTLLMSSIMASLWMWVGERNVLRLRKAIYDSVTRRPMHWFDLKMGQGAGDADKAGDGGAGGMVTKFTSETDDVRMASSLNTGMLVQYVTTFITCLVLALIVSWALTLVILSSIPLLVFVQGLSQSFTIPLYNAERSQSAAAGTHIERTVRNIPTVKAFNAQQKEQNKVNHLLEVARQAYRRCCVAWGLTSGMMQFILWAMFVQGFWFGSKLVREGKLTPGQVMAVFWACLVASSNLQLCVPLLVVLTKGKAAMSNLDTLIHAPTPPAPSTQIPTKSLMSPTTPRTPLSTRKSFPHLRSRNSGNQEMTRIIPSGKAHGAFSLHNIRFAYPSRPDVPILNVEEIYLPSAETTFVVGGSGSGKSTVSHLLLRLYQPASGTILFDDRDIRYLDEKYVRSHVAAVAQTCVLFDMSVHDNVAIGVAGGGMRRPQDVTREEVERVCRAGLMHEFIRDLPDGYETKLGTAGASLSGGQRQRLAIARALLRDPTVLILDEATSALDATSRVLVFEAIKAHRKNRTTIVITHDLSQITPEDFVYVMKDGVVVEQGYRSALEVKSSAAKKGGEGEFRRMLDAQFESGGFPTKGDAELGLEDASIHDSDWEEIESDEDDGLPMPSVRNSKHVSITNAVIASFKHFSGLGKRESKSARRASRKSILATSVDSAASGRASHGAGAPKWMFDAVADLAVPKSSAAIQQAVHARRASKFEVSTLPFNTAGRPRRSFQLPRVGPSTTTAQQQQHPQEDDEDDYQPRPSLQFEPMSPTAPQGSGWPRATKGAGRDEYDDEFGLEDDDEFEKEKDAIKASGDAAGARRRNYDLALRGVKVATPEDAESNKDVQPPLPTLFGITKRFFPTLPNKFLVLFGVLICMVNGALTPIFSIGLSNLMVLTGSGATDTRALTLWGVGVLVISFADGCASGFKFFIMETGAMTWVTSLRKNAYETVLRQDKQWFDDEKHSAEKVVQIIVKDGDDARMLVSTVLAQMAVVASMLGVGLIWALVRGWQLTLVGFAIGPVFALAMMGQSTLMARYELSSKRTREEVSKQYFEAVSNVRAIRSMALEQVFDAQYEKSCQAALKAGVTGAMVAGTGYGVANALVYIAEAVLFYVGAVLLAKGLYSYLQLIETLNLVVFTVSIAAQIMTFVPRIAKANQAAADFDTILSCTQPTNESHGQWRFPIQGNLSFEHVDFAYPNRSDVPVLKDVNFTVKEGECVAIVGPSGSGKSTLAALLQRLYEPATGSIRIGQFAINDADIVWLRSQIAVVSQQPALFDASIKDNILYGHDADSISFDEVQRAARDANVDDFIESLPDGYDTMLGENASLISGGQAQRIQLARALVNGKANILLLDEFTSALDVTNQEALMSTVMKIKEDRTTIIVTHKLPVMRRCDRVIVVLNGEIVEQGTYDSLMANRSHFWNMATAGDLANE
ncbi:hypothetical protein M407DRAFT_225395 [Tulasnella calospora MUT 4182]|uniref:P-loop containing nucleoside triphosphate hydrolase protein n=1 Tax=Tulasnella calospora MUT 4182 TaxID=1051891 RepID=A0A0C3M8R4_9AGAM|nr:hypothetical protein M407DRAFT_225395 [Tulasnella calospora MUT 4182]